MGLSLIAERILDFRSEGIVGRRKAKNHVVDRGLKGR